MEEVVFMLQVKRSERGFESRPPSSLVSPDALLQVDRRKRQKEEERASTEREGEKTMKGGGSEVGYRFSVTSTSQSNPHLGVSVLALASPSLGTLK